MADNMDEAAPSVLRMLTAVVGCWVALLSLTCWVVSFMPTEIIVHVLSAAVFSCFFLGLVFFGFMVLDMRNSGSDARGWISHRARRFPLNGWRAPLGVMAFGLFAFTFLASLVSGGLDAGGPQERAGRYYTNNHGAFTEISKQEWIQRSADETRVFAAAAFALSLMSGLYFTQSKDCRRRAHPY